MEVNDKDKSRLTGPEEGEKCLLAIITLNTQHTQVLNVSNKKT